VSAHPTILLTNDDGIDAPGIMAVYKALIDRGFKVIVVAPESEKSAVGHAITLSEPLRVKKVAKDCPLAGYSVTGTPADCVKIAFWTILEKKPDLIISGINLGANTGINMLYSGTVSAATEGAMLGIPSFAISLATYKNPDFDFAARFSCKIAEEMLNNQLPQGVYLNINIPAIDEKEIKGISVTRQGNEIFREKFEKRYDPRGNTYYWLSGQKINKESNIEIDESAVQSGYISITPVHFDLTHYESIETVKSWDVTA